MLPRHDNPRPGQRRATLLAVLAVVALSAGCVPPEVRPAPLSIQATPSPIQQPEHCLGDGAVQTWLLLPNDPPESQLLDAYQAGQVIEFQATVIGSNDDPARLPHRSFYLREAAEGITITLDYQGDPPPLVSQQTYRMVAWADLVESLPSPPAETPEPGATPPIPDARGYELQVFDGLGLLFLGVTDVDLQDDPLQIALEDVQGDCAAVPRPSDACVENRLVQPLLIRWGDQEVTLYPGDDGQLVHDGALYVLSVYRNRVTEYPETPCLDYYEHQRSLRVERIDPPPEVPTPEGTITATLLLSPTQPLSVTVPITAPSE